MNVNSTATPTLSGAPKHGAGRIILAVVGGGVLVLSVALGAAWAYSGSDAPAATPPDPEPGVSIPEPPVVPAVSFDWTIYVVGSEEEAVAVREGVNEANLIRRMTGEPALSDSVIVLSAEIPLYEMLVAVPGTVIDFRTR